MGSSKYSGEAKTVQIQVNSFSNAGDINTIQPKAIGYKANNSCSLSKDYYTNKKLSRQNEIDFQAMQDSIKKTKELMKSAAAWNFVKTVVITVAIIAVAYYAIPFLLTAGPAAPAFLQSTFVAMGSFGAPFLSASGALYYGGVAVAGAAFVTIYNFVDNYSQGKDASIPFTDNLFGVPSIFTINKKNGINIPVMSSLYDWINTATEHKNPDDEPTKCILCFETLGIK